MRTIFAHLFFILGISFAGHSAWAQEPAVDTVKATITLLCWDNVLAIEYPDFEGEEPLEVPMQVRSIPHRYEGPRQFIITEPAVGDSQNSPKPKPIASVSLPLNADRVLIILIPQSTQHSNLPYRSITINDSFNIFPRQSLRILNTTPYTLTGKLGETVFEVAPKSEAIASPLETRGPKYLVPFRIARYHQAEEVWRPLRSTIFQMYPDVRILALILDDPDQASLRFVLLRDRTPPEPTSPTGNDEGIQE